MRRIIYIFAGLSFVVCLAGLAPAGAQSGALKNRSEINPSLTWNLSDLYADAKAWESDYSRLEKVLIPKAASYQGKLSDAKNVLEALRASDDCSRLADKLYLFAGLRSDEDTSDSARTEMRSRIESLYARASVARAYIRPEILALSEQTIRSFIADPQFADYAHSLDALLLKKKHTLPREQEEILSGAAETAGAMQNVYAKLSYADVTVPEIKDKNGKKIQITESSYQALLKDGDRDLRRRAFESRYAFYAAHRNTFAELMNYEVKKNIFYARAYKYNTSLEASLADDFIPRQVYDNLIASVNARLPYLRRYVELRKKALGVDKVRLYDMYYPFSRGFSRSLSYDDAKKMILTGLTPLGGKYLEDLSSIFSSRWADVYETKGKKSGGYCWGAYDTHPYVLLNFNDTVDEMLTVAHEMGHAMHNNYSAKNQPYPNSDTAIFTAEVASTTNELLMTKYLIRNAKSDDEKLFYLDQIVEQIRGTVYTQVMYSEFESLMHERAEKGDALSADSLRAMWKSLMEKYYGPEFASDDLGTLWWARIGHFYRCFYVYKYATSISAANQIVKNMDDGKNADAQKKYLSFLKSGSSDYPVELLKKAGVDMTTPQPVDSILSDFNGYVDEMERILKKQGRIK
jgi:oligoendopeptidase F